MKLLTEKKILVTGGAGFIGSHVIRHLLEVHADLHIVNLDALTYAGNIENLSDLSDDSAKRHTFIEGNICDRELVNGLFQKPNRTERILLPHACVFVSE